MKNCDAQPQHWANCYASKNSIESDVPASRHPLNPLASPGWRLKGVREILCLVHDLAVAELHDAHCVCRPPLVHDCVFRDPEIIFPENSLVLEPGRLARMMTPQGLQIASSEDSFA